MGGWRRFEVTELPSSSPPSVLFISFPDTAHFLRSKLKWAPLLSKLVAPNGAPFNLLKQIMLIGLIVLISAGFDEYLEGGK